MPMTERAQHLPFVTESNDSPSTRRVTITFTMPIGNPDKGAEIDLEVTADCDTNADDILDGVTFVEPTLRDLQDYYGDRYIDRLALACAEQAQRDIDMERDVAERGKAMANELIELGRTMNRVALAERMCGKSQTDAQLAALDVAIAKVGGN